MLIIGQARAGINPFSFEFVGFSAFRRSFQNGDRQTYLVRMRVNFQLNKEPRPRNSLTARPILMALPETPDRVGSPYGNERSEARNCVISIGPA